MTCLSKTSAGIAATLLSCTAQAAMAAAGYMSTELEVAHRDRSVPLHIYYPGQEDGVKIRLGKNAVFKGADVSPDAAPIAGPHPIVLLAHGSGGNAVNLAWLGGHLADAGFIVLAPNHPGTTSGDSIQTETIKIWERPMDHSAILDFVESGALNHLNPDMTQVGIVGFSLGGYSALSMVGARVSHQAYLD